MLFLKSFSAVIKPFSCQSNLSLFVLADAYSFFRSLLTISTKDMMSLDPVVFSGLAYSIFFAFIGMMLTNSTSKFQWFYSDFISYYIVS